MLNAASTFKIRVLSQAETLELSVQEISAWNILSVSDRAQQQDPLLLNGARRVLRLHFDDVEEDYPKDRLFAATAEDIRNALGFSRKINNEPLLIHCYAGISRSTALAWIILWDKIRAEPHAVRKAFTVVRSLRPNLRPNHRVLLLGINELAAKNDRQEAFEQFRSCLYEIDCAGPIYFVDTPPESSPAI